MTNTSAKEARKNNRRNKLELVRIFAISLVLIIVVPLILMVYNRAYNKPQVMEIKMPDKPILKDSIPTNGKIIHLYLVSGDRFFYSVQEGKTIGGLTLAANSQMDSLFEKNKSTIILLKPCRGSSYKNVVNTFDQFSINSIQKYALVDPTEEEEKKLKIELENGN